MGGLGLGAWGSGGSSAQDIRSSLKQVVFPNSNSTLVTNWKPTCHIPIPDSRKARPHDGNFLTVTLGPLFLPVYEHGRYSYCTRDPINDGQGPSSPCKTRCPKPLGLLEPLTSEPSMGQKSKDKSCFLRNQAASASCGSRARYASRPCRGLEHGRASDIYSCPVPHLRHLLCRKCYFILPHLPHLLHLLVRKN